MGKIKSILVAAALLVGAWLIGYVIGRNHIPSTVEKVQIDTLVRHDTIRIESPLEIRRIKTTDTLILPITDTLRVRDTVYSVLNRQIKEYRDSLFYARVSGYDPKLDFIEVYPKTMVISKTETTTLNPSPWRYGITVGLDYGMMWGKYITPNVGAEIGYKKLTLGVECGVNMSLVNSTIETPMPYLQASIKYRLAGR